MFGGPGDSLGRTVETTTIVPTPDGGYLLGGFFNQYQGISVNNLAKLDSNGRIQPEYFPLLEDLIVLQYFQKTLVQFPKSFLPNLEVIM